MLALLAVLGLYDCPPGLRWTRYLDEVGFTRPTETKIVDKLDGSSFNIGYNAIIAKGSFCPKESGTYSVRIWGRPCAQLVFNNNHSPAVIGPAGSCLGSFHTDASITQDLVANKCYQIQANLRTGCTLYKQYLGLTAYKEPSHEEVPLNETNLIACTWENCEEHHYGENCDQKCVDSCGNGFCHNGTQGNGKCVCDDLWTGDQCDKKDEDYVNGTGEHGTHYTVFNNEVSFIGPNWEGTLESAKKMDIGNVYNSAKMTGSVTPELAGDYQFRILAKPAGKLITFDGIGYPDVLGPAASCLESLHTDKTTKVLHLESHTSYGYEIQYRSGCGLVHSKYIQLMWKNGPKWGSLDAAPWEDVPNFTLTENTITDCVPEYFGPTCDGICDKCPPNMMCNGSFTGDGHCMCKPDADDCHCARDEECLHGGTCSEGLCKCKLGYYGDNCERYCTDPITCHGHGHCSAVGYCECESGYFGLECETACTRKDACNDHGECANATCTCDTGFEGNTCQRYPYQPSPNESSKGIIMAGYNNEFFSGGWSIPPTLEDTVNFDFNHMLYHSVSVFGSLVFKDRTRVKLRAFGKPFVQIHVHLQTLPWDLGPAGSCLNAMKVTEDTDEFEVFPNIMYPLGIWYRSGCSIWSQHLQLYWKIGNMSMDWELVPKEYLRSTDDRICLERYSGLMCDQYCDADCSMNGDCVMKGSNSTCKCFDNYFGDHCELKCVPEETCHGHGRCIEGGKCACDMFHSGDYCEIGCNAETTCNSHGVCNEQGTCSCNQGWEGSTCAQHKYMPSPDEAPQGVNYTLYTYENFEGSTKEGPVVVPDINMTWDPVLAFESSVVTGAIVVNDSIAGKLRVNAKPYGQLLIGGGAYPEEIGPRYSCWGLTYTYAETPEMRFEPNRMYNFTFKYRSGCGFIQQYMELEWKIGADQDWSLVPEENLMVPKAGQTCVDRYSGSECNVYCDADCSMHGDCIIKDQQSKCACFSGYSGDHCETFSS